MACVPRNGEEGAAICHRCVCDTILRRLHLKPSRISVAPGFSERSVYQARLIGFLHQVIAPPLVLGHDRRPLKQARYSRPSEVGASRPIHFLFHAPTVFGAYELVVSVKTEDGFGVSRVPVSVQYEGVASGDLLTDEKGRCTHVVAIIGKATEVTVESPGLKSWSTRLFSQASNLTP